MAQRPRNSQPLSIQREQEASTREYALLRTIRNLTRAVEKAAQYETWFRDVGLGKDHCINLGWSETEYNRMLQIRDTTVKSRKTIEAALVGFNKVASMEYAPEEK